MTNLIQQMQSFIAEQTETVHSVVPTMLENGNFKIDMAVGFDDDRIDVCFEFLSLQDDDNPAYDVDIKISNNDWAGLSEMHKALGLAIEKFKYLGFDKSCFALGLESYHVAGM